MNKLNLFLIIITGSFLVLGWLVPVFWSPLFILSAIMWIVGFSYFTNTCFLKCARRQKLTPIGIFIIKTICLLLTAVLYYVPIESISSIIVVVTFEIVLLIEIICFPMKKKLCSFDKKKMEETKDLAQKSEQIIYGQYDSYLLGNKESLFGKNSRAKITRKLALSGMTFVVTILSAAISLIIGNFAILPNDCYYVMLVLILYLTVTILFYHLLGIVISKNCKKIFISLYLSIYILLLFFAPVAKQHLILGYYTGFYLHMYLIGCGSLIHAILSCKAVSNLLNQMMLQSE